MKRSIRWHIGSLLFVLGSTALLYGQPDPARDQAGDRPEMTPRRTDVKPFAYKEAKVPFYPPGRGGSGKPLTQMQLPLDPNESAKHFVTPKDFEVKLFAAEPQIRRPIGMNWDERGRLWIAESIDYPNERKRRGEGRDRLVICEDTNNDGKADKITVFADNLSIPTGFTFYKGGVIVVQAPDTLYLKDTDGDGKADQRTVLFSGWGTGDTHAGPSNLHYGFDNWIYGILGYSGFEGTVGGERHSFRQGFFRFRPDGSKLEFLRNTNNNSWGVGFSEEGVLFGSTANGNPSVYLPIPNRAYDRVRGWSSRVLGGIAGNAPMHPITDKVRQVDWHGHFTAAAGHALYTARLYPKTYWNRAAFVTEPTGHLVASFLIEKRGADYRSYNAFNLLASDDEWAAPIMAEVGPDGCVWVIDWYNYIVQHNPTPTGFKTGRGNAYETPLRDKTHGRIYRIVPRGAKPAAAPSLAGARPEALVAALKNDNLFWRRHAQRLLVERGQRDVVPALVALIADPSVDAIGLNVGAIHALWTLHGLGSLDGSDGKAAQAASAALAHKSAGVRRNAAAVQPRTAAGRDALLRSKVLSDADGQVQLAALLALAEMPPSAEAGAAVLAVLGRAETLRDPWLPDAATAAAAAHDIHFLTAAARTKFSAARARDVVATVAEHYARGGPAESVAALLETLPTGAPQTVEVILTGLSRGWPIGRGAKIGVKTGQALEKLASTLPAGGRGRLVALAKRLGTDRLEKYAAAITADLLATAADEKRSTEERLTAARQAIAFRPDDAAIVEKLLDSVTPRVAPELASGLLDALGESRSGDLGALLTARLPTFGPQSRGAALRVLLSLPEATRALLDALEKGQARLSDLALDQKQALAAHPDRTIAARARKLLARGGGLPNPDRQKVLAEYLPLLHKKGDVALGKAAFKKHCATCHMHSGEGNKVGPDLTGVAAHTREHLLTDILDPSRNVEGNFRVWTVTTQDGRVFTGLLASESKNAIELYDAQAKKHVIQRADIEQMAAAPSSLMPEGFEKQLTKDELTNLLEFLTQRGKYLALPLEKVATVTSVRGMFNSTQSPVERLIFADWGPKTFKGVPFRLVDPRDGRVPNVILLRGRSGTIPPKMPSRVKLEYNGPARAIHLLSGISGWGYPASKKGTLAMTVRLHYADGSTEDHELRNGEHFADYIRRVDVPGSEFAYALRGQQLRYLAIHPRRTEGLTSIEFVSGGGISAPVVMAVTVEGT